MSSEDEREQPVPGKVVALATVRGARREPQLSDAELVAVRRMLAEFEVIATGCPLASRLLDRD